MSEYSFHHGGVSIPDLDEAITWYERVLGFEVERRFHIDVARSEVAMIRKGSVRFELCQTEGAATLPDGRRDPLTDLQTHGNKHVALCIDELDAFLDEMNSKQVDIALIIREEFGRGCYIRDLAGNLIEFVEVPRS